MAQRTAGSTVDDALDIDPIDTVTPAAFLTTVDTADYILGSEATYL